MRQTNQYIIELGELLDGLPPIVPRHIIANYLPGIISPGTLANLDCKGLGPRRFRIGGKIAYRKTDLIEWLAQRVR